MTLPLKSVALAAALMAALPLTHAHITLEYPVAQAASGYKATFKVGHGCAGSPIRQIVVNIPAGVQGAKPMPKAGWAIAVERTRLAQPYTSHGRTIVEDVTRITWTARTPDDWLPNAFYDEFVLHARLPSQPGAMYWSVSQVCEQGRIDWAEVPRDGQALADLKAPAALLDILPSGAGAHHHH